MAIQLHSIYYEICQAMYEKKDYYQDFWNYMEILEFCIFATGAVLDIYYKDVDERVRILLVGSVLLSLFKFLTLTRCFTSLSFLI